MGKIKVAVLMGGRSAERQVSLSTGRQVLQSLNPDRYEVVPVDVAFLTTLAGGEAAPAVEIDAFTGTGPGASARELPLLGENRPDVALICLHGRYGEDGTIQGMLELLDIPYTGSGVLGSALAINKVMSKKIFRMEGIPTPISESVCGRAEAQEFLARWNAGTSDVAPPVIVKPATQGSTIGCAVVHSRDEMAAALNTALEYDDEVLVETFIEKHIEITAAVLGNDTLDVLPLIEIVPNTGFYDYERKYTPGATEEICPARISDAQAEKARDLAIRAHRALGCRGVSRVDMLVTEDEIWVLEVNTIPGMTPTSLLPRAAAEAGLPFPQLLDRLIELALEGRVRESTPCESSAA